MYSIINTNPQFIEIESEKLKQHFKDYIFLIEGKHLQEDEILYRKKFKKFWGMNAARQIANNQDFYNIYFDFLKQKNEHKSFNFNDLLSYIEKTNAGFQFSFATKAVHTLNRNLPIYDANVRRFYFLNDIDSSKSWQQKLEIANKYYQFLSVEYKRIQEYGLLEPVIDVLDSFLLQIDDIDPNQITQTKKIDSIIWAWVDYLNNGAIINEKIKWE